MWKLFVFLFALFANTQAFGQIATVQVNSPGTNLVRGSLEANLICFAFTPTSGPVTIDKIRAGVVKTGFTNDWTTPGILNASLGNLQFQDQTNSVLALVPQLEECPGAIINFSSWSCEVDLVPDLVFLSPQTLCYMIDLAETGPILGVALLRGELQVTTTMNASSGMGSGFVPTQTVQGPNRVLDPQQIFQSSFE